MLELGELMHQNPQKEWKVEEAQVKKQNHRLLEKDLDRFYLQLLLFSTVLSLVIHSYLRLKKLSESKS